MYVLKSIGVILIALTIIDAIYFLYKKYLEFVSKKSGQKRESNISLLYPAAFLIGCIVRIFTYSNDATFFILLKESLLWGMLAILIIANISVIKKKFKNIGKDVFKLKDIEKSDGEKLFKKKDKK